MLVMKNLLCMVLLSMLSSSAVLAQDVELLAPRAGDGFFVAEDGTQTRHSESHRREVSAQELVHRNAAMRAAERHERMAINARFGYSPSRPPTSTVPFMGSPSSSPLAFRVYTVYPGFVFPRPYSRF